jgi:decaprenyl-phosphate phosphoribosyltransferase
MSVAWNGSALPSRSPGRTVWAILRCSRPTQWVKNVLVLAAPAAAGRFPHGATALRLALTVVAFCAAAGGTYMLNDLADVEADRRHPRKRRRPVAAGELTAGSARVAGAGFLAVGVVAALAVNPAVAVAVAGYELLTVAYSRWLKHLAVLDVAVLAAGFLLRAMAGAAAAGIGVRASFLGVVFFGAMFVAVAKRQGEVHELGDGAVGHRRVLATYSDRALGGLLAGSLAAATLSYWIWAVVRPDGEGATWLDLSLLPFLAGAARFAYLAFRGRAADPQRILADEHVLQLAALALVVMAAAGAHAAALS